MIGACAERVPTVLAPNVRPFGMTSMPSRTHRLQVAERCLGGSHLQAVSPCYAPASPGPSTRLGRFRAWVRKLRLGGGKAEPERLAQALVGAGLRAAAAALDLVDDRPAHPAPAGGLGLGSAKQLAAPTDIGGHRPHRGAREFHDRGIGVLGGRNRVRHRGAAYLRLRKCRAKWTDGLLSGK